ncbi:CdaR family transcriptional regulator [Falsibacillus pallidus]|uniref:CdaR family transcriptional regulator n=1 Tax=Falsibacillus pallidus TaxID=493781 RepID=A0A370GE90_9BACI|nr:sugar diacid recognition domain-containing protein [Falsibacillus pallidus]RDI41419.1 CdaR family transcriptional regulator [Falsibacillus pallidus]
MLSKNLANKIVQDVRRLLDEEIIVVSPEGTIIAGTDKSRIGQFHEGALFACSEKKSIIITEKDASRWIGVKPGINLPVFFQDKTAGVIGITGNPEKVSPFGEILKKMTELIIQENFYIEELNLEVRTLEAFIFDWIELQDRDESFHNRAAVLGIDLQHSHQLALLKIPGEKLPIPTHLISKWNDHHPFSTLVRWGNDRLVAILDMDESRSEEAALKELGILKSFLERELSTPLFMGVGSIRDSASMKASYREAERALASANTMEPVVFESQLTLEMLTQSIRPDIKEAFLSRTIGQLNTQPALIQTLRLFFENDMSFTNTADAAHIHINTLHYRFKKIEQLTSLHPRKAKDLVTLYLALSFLDE